jgi:hypothetical protein
MEQPESSVQPLLHNRQRRPDDGPLPSIRKPSVQSLPHDRGFEMSVVPRHSKQGSPLPVTEAQATSRQDPSDTISLKSAQSDAHFNKRSPSIGWKQWLHTLDRAWGRSWTAETCSYIISILALAGLIATLLAHHSKPLPQWPQLVTINSIISLFSMLMRACVGVVLAEGSV